ncbi:MAG: hypothetical protein RL007_625 [Bacteroidota bacterium]|jgi:hypothetical protein
MSNNLFLNWNETKSIEKFDRIISNANFIRYAKYDSQEMRRNDIVEMLEKIEALRYELGHTKATESTSSNIDKVLASLALEMANRIYEKQDLKKFIDGVLYYEKNEQLRKIYMLMLE